MTIKLYINKSAPNVCDKVLDSETTVEGYVRDATSLLNPTIVLQRNSPVGFNYFLVPEFERYYFLTGVSTVVNGLVSITGTVDVAMTYKSQFREWNAVVKRNENKYNVLLDDGIFKAYQNSKHKVIAFPRKMDDYSFILAIGGNS